MQRVLLETTPSNARSYPNQFGQLDERKLKIGSSSRQNFEGLIQIVIILFDTY